MQTKPRPGSEPNYNTVLEFSAKLPIDKLYRPILPCEIYDCVFFGASQPLIGTLNIDLGKVIADF